MGRTNLNDLRTSVASSLSQRELVSLQGADGEGMDRYFTDALAAVDVVPHCHMYLVLHRGGLQSAICPCWLQPIVEGVLGEVDLLSIPSLPFAVVRCGRSIPIAIGCDSISRNLNTRSSSTKVVGTCCDTASSNASRKRSREALGEDDSEKVGSVRLHFTDARSLSETKTMKGAHIIVVEALREPLGEALFSRHHRPLFMPLPMMTSSAVTMKGCIQRFPDPLNGLYFIEEFISREEEDDLLRQLRDTSTSSIRWETVNQRKVVHFGARFVYGSNSFERPSDGNSVHDKLVAPTPPWVFGLKERMVQAFTTLPSLEVTKQVSEMDQTTVNWYPVGAGIPAHVDHETNFGPAIVSLSLGTAAVMEFTSLGDEGPSAKASVVLRPRSLLIMTGTSRYHFMHSIPGRKVDHALQKGTAEGWRRGERLSITFRRCCD